MSQVTQCDADGCESLKAGELEHGFWHLTVMLGSVEQGTWDLDYCPKHARETTIEQAFADAERIRLSCPTPQPTT